MKVFKPLQILPSQIQSSEASRPNYHRFHFASKSYEIKDPFLKQHRKHLYYIRSIQIHAKHPSHSLQKIPSVSSFRHSSFKKVFKVVQKICIKVVKLNHLCFLLRNQRTLTHFKLQIEKAKLPYQQLKRVIRQSSNSRIKHFFLMRETGEFKPMQFVYFLRQMAFFPSLETLGGQIDYSPFFFCKGKPSKLMEEAIIRLNNLKQVGFDYQLGVLSKEFTRFLGIAFGKLRKLKEFFPKLTFNYSDCRELEFIANLCKSKSLETLNMAIQRLSLENIKMLSAYIKELKSLRSLVLSLMCQEIVALENPLWLTISRFDNLDDLDLSIHFFRTASIPDDYFANFSQLKNLIRLKRLRLMLTDKRNNQGFFEMWKVLMNFKNLESFELELKDFKLLKDDYIWIGNVSENPKKLKHLKLNFSQLGYYVEKELFEEIRRGITGKGREELLETLSLRFEVGNGIIVKGILVGNYKVLKNFEFEADIFAGNKGNCEEIKQFMEKNQRIEDLVIRFQNKKEKFSLRDEQSNVLDLKSLEELFEEIKKLRFLQKLELAFAEWRRIKKEEFTKQGMQIGPLLSLLKNLSQLKEIKVDFPRNFVRESDLLKFMNLCMTMILRKVIIKVELKEFNNHIKGLIKKFNIKYGNEKDPKEEK